MDKIGIDGVADILRKKDISEASIQQIKRLLEVTDLANLKTLFTDSEIGLKGIEELEAFHSYFDLNETKNEVKFDITLARGLSYYTGCIIEVAAKDYEIGSIGGGGRYDDLTGSFGLKGVSGVGVSFGAARIFDVMEALDLFPDTATEQLSVLLIAFDQETHQYAFKCLSALRAVGINSELYPSPSKLKKQMKYANDRKVPYTILIGSQEMGSETLTFKNMESGEQQKLPLQAIIDTLKS